MFDSDLAELYGTVVKNINKQVKRNIEKFPVDFMFQMTIEEAKSLRFLNGTLNKRSALIKYAPYVFTERCVYMVPTILKK